MKQTLWCCVRGNKYELYTLKYTRKDSIKELMLSIKELMLGSIWEWKDCQTFGWKCIKVEVIIKLIKNQND